MKKNCWNLGLKLKFSNNQLVSEIGLGPVKETRLPPGPFISCFAFLGVIRARSITIKSLRESFWQRGGQLAKCLNILMSVRLAVRSWGSWYSKHPLSHSWPPYHRIERIWDLSGWGGFLWYILTRLQWRKVKQWGRLCNDLLFVQRDNDWQKCNTDGAGEKLISQLPLKYSQHRDRLTNAGTIRSRPFTTKKPDDGELK